MKLRDEKEYSKSIEELEKLFAQEDKKHKMPDSLLSENLMHLLPDQPQEPENENETIFEKIKDWLTSKKAIPAYTVLVAALFALMIVPKLIVSNDLEAGVRVQQEQDIVAASVPEEEQDVSPEEKPPTDEPEQQSTVITKQPEHQSQGELEADSEQEDKGEDLSKYYEDREEHTEETPEKDTEDRLRSSPYREEAKDQVTGEGGSRSSNYSKGTIKNHSSSPTPPRTEEEPAPPAAPEASADVPEKQQDESKESTTTKPETETNEQSEQQSPAQEEESAVAAAVPFSVESDFRGYYLGDWNGYSLYWRTATAEETGDVILEAVDSSGNTAFTHPFTGIHQINVSFVADKDNLIVIGSGMDRTVVYKHFGIEDGKFTESASQEIIGKYLTYDYKENSIAVFTTMPEIPPSYSGEIIALDGSAETGAVGALLWDFEENKLKKIVISGTNPENISVENGVLSIGYKSSKGESKTVKYEFNKTSLTEKK